MSSAAEQALKKKFALLQKRKEAAAGGKGGGGAASGSAGAGAARATAASPAAATKPTAAPSGDAARQAAIRALQAQRSEAAKAASAAAGASGTGAGNGAAAKPQTKLKLVIPKREMVTQPAAAKPAAQKPAGQQAPADPARAAALAALRARAAAGASGAAGAAGQGAGSQQGAQPATAQQQQQPEQPKRPGMKRPSARPRPTPQQQLQAAAGSAGASAAAALDGTFGVDAAQLQQQQMDQFLEGGGFGHGSEERDGRESKRQRHDAEEGTTLFVGDLPAFWGTPDLLDFFSREFGNAVEARVIGSQCYGFVTFGSPEDAEQVLEFAQQQGVWAEDRMLRINWAQGSMPEWKKGPAVHHTLDGAAGGEGGQRPVLEAYENPRVKEARMQAQQLAATVDAQQIQMLAMQPPPERQLVSYEDL